MPTVSTDTGAYQALADIRSRIDHRPDDLFDDNAALRFDELLVRLERESRGIFETLWGDQTPLEETDRIDEKRTTDDAALKLVYPIQDVTKVERKVSLASEWKELDDEWYDYDDHHLILARRPNTRLMRQRQRGNVLAGDAERAPWRALGEKIRVTYDRGFAGGAPADIKSLQIQLISNMLTKLRTDQTIAAGSPDELAQAVDTDMIVTEEIRDRISDVTSPGYATMSV